jgi:hypothetical protein
MVIGGVGIFIGIIMFVEGKQRSSNCSRIGREDGVKAGVRWTSFDTTVESQLRMAELLDKSDLAKSEADSLPTQYCRQTAR